MLVFRRVYQDVASAGARRGRQRLAAENRDGGVACVILVPIPFKIRATEKRVVGGELMTTWGASDPNAGPGQYRGDVYFDYYHRYGAAPSSSITTWRPSGSDGQILFYVNQHPEDPHPTIAVGVCLTAGGPEQFSAIRAGVASFTRSLP